MAKKGTGRKSHFCGWIIRAQGSLTPLSRPAGLSQILLQAPWVAVSCYEGGDLRKMSRTHCLASFRGGSSPSGVMGQGWGLLVSR